MNANKARNEECHKHVNELLASCKAGRHSLSGDIRDKPRVLEDQVFDMAVIPVAPRVVMGARGYYRLAFTVAG